MSWRERERERVRVGERSVRVEEVFEGEWTIKTREMGQMAGCKLRQSGWERVEKSF